MNLYFFNEFETLVCCYIVNLMPWKQKNIFSIDIK